MFLPSGVFLLEYWDENKKTNIPHLGLTVTVRDPNNAVWSIQLFMHKWESYNKLLIISICINSSETFCHMQVVLLKRFGRYGKFTFKSHASGQHFLCVQSNSTRFSVFAGDRLVSCEMLWSHILNLTCLECQLVMLLLFYLCTESAFRCPDGRAYHWS